MANVISGQPAKADHRSNQQVLEPPRYICRDPETGEKGTGCFRTLTRSEAEVGCCIDYPYCTVP